MDSLFHSDGRSLCKSSRRKAAIEARQAREYASLNQETHMHQIVIPRTQRLNTLLPPLNKEDFANLLIEKLTAVKRSQEQQEVLDRKLKEVRIHYKVYNLCSPLYIFSCKSFQNIIILNWRRK